jgi:hypothetical protein
MFAAFTRRTSAALLPTALVSALTLVGCDARTDEGDCVPGDDAPRCDGQAIATCESGEYPSWILESCDAWVCDESSGRPTCVAPPPQALRAVGTVDGCTRLFIPATESMPAFPAPERTAVPVAALAQDPEGGSILTAHDIALVDAVPVTADTRPTAALAAAQGASLQPHVERAAMAGTQFVRVNERLAYLVEIQDYEGEVDLTEVILCAEGDRIATRFAFTPGGVPGRVNVVVATLLDDAEVGRTAPVALTVE